MVSVLASRRRRHKLHTGRIVTERLDGDVFQLPLYAELYIFVILSDSYNTVTKRYNPRLPQVAKIDVQEKGGKVRGI